MLLKWLKYQSLFTPFWRALAFPVGGFLWLRFWLIRKTANVRVLGQELDVPTIYVNWHKHVPYLLQHHGKKNRVILCSGAPYMEPIAKLCLWLGLRLIRGASGENGRQAIQLLSEQLKERQSIVIAVDGPGGPIFKCKAGCVELARSLKVPIVAVGYRCKKGTPNKKRWDQSLMPAFFDEIELEFSPPLSIPESESIESGLALVESALNAIHVGTSIRS